MGTRQSVSQNNSDDEQTFDNYSKINFVTMTTEEKPRVCVDPRVLEELRIGPRLSGPQPEPSLVSRGRHRNSIAVIRPRLFHSEHAKVFSIKRKRRRGSLVSVIIAFYQLSFRLEH